MSEATDQTQDFEEEGIFQYAQKCEQNLLDQLIDKQNQFQEPETQREKQIKEDYGKFLTFKAHGAGAFGSVTEYYDLYRRKKFARKQFADLKDLSIELEAYEKLEQVFGKQNLYDIVAPIKRMDVENNTLFYEQGLITLNDYCDQKLDSQDYWFEDEKELGYIIHELFDLVMKLCDKNIYHSDLKLVNAIICEDKFNRNYLKLIDVGAVTFDFRYVVAITNAYFPDMEKFDVTQSQESRILGELYQFGRMIQEICLTSIYSKNKEIYVLSGMYRSYKEFKKYYFQNEEEFIKKSLEIIQQYYSKEVYELIGKCLNLKSSPKEIQKIINKIGKNEFLEDFFGYVPMKVKQKQDDYFNKMFTNDGQGEIQNLYEELNFYLEFELDYQGYQKLDNYFNKNYEGNRNHEDYKDKDAFLFAYESIIVARYPPPSENNNTVVAPLTQDFIHALSSDEEKYYYNKINKVLNQNDYIDQNMRDNVLIQVLYSFKRNLGEKLKEKEKYDLFMQFFQISSKSDDLFHKYIYKWTKFEKLQSKMLESEWKNLEKESQQMIEYAKKCQDMKKQRNIFDYVFYLNLDLVEFFKTSTRVVGVKAYDYYVKTYFKFTEGKDEELFEIIIKDEKKAKELVEKMKKQSHKIVEWMDKQSQTISNMQERLKQRIVRVTGSNQYHNSVEIKGQDIKVINQKLLEESEKSYENLMEMFKLVEANRDFLKESVQEYITTLFYLKRKKEAVLYTEYARKLGIVVVDWFQRTLEGKEWYEYYKTYIEYGQKYKRIREVKIFKNSVNISQSLELPEDIEQHYKKLYEQWGQKNVIHYAKWIIVKIVMNLTYQFNLHWSFDQKTTFCYNNYEGDQKRSELEQQIDGYGEGKEIIDKDFYEAHPDPYQLIVQVDPDLSHREVKNEDIDYQISVTTIFAYIAHFMVNLRLKGPQYSVLSCKFILQQIEKIIKRIQNLSQQEQNEVILYKIIYAIQGLKQGENIEEEQELIRKYIKGGEKLQGATIIQQHMLGLLKQWNSMEYIPFSYESEINKENQVKENIDQKKQQKQQQEEKQVQENKQQEYVEEDQGELGLLEKEIQVKEKEKEKQQNNNHNQSKKQKKKKNKQQQQQNQEQNNQGKKQGKKGKQNRDNGVQQQQQQQNNQRQQQQQKNTQQSQQQQQPQYNRSSSQQKEKKQQREDTACCVIF